MKKRRKWRFRASSRKCRNEENGDGRRRTEEPKKMAMEELLRASPRVRQQELLRESTGNVLGSELLREHNRNGLGSKLLRES